MTAQKKVTSMAFDRRSRNKVSTRPPTKTNRTILSASEPTSCRNKLVMASWSRLPNRAQSVRIALAKVVQAGGLVVVLRLGHVWRDRRFRGVRGMGASPGGARNLSCWPDNAFGLSLVRNKGISRYGHRGYKF